MGYANKLADILTKEFGDKRSYCIRNADDKVITGNTDNSYCIEPRKKGGWRVFIQEPGRGNVYEDYHLDTEREACVKFIEMTKDEYHLSKYLSEFEKETE